MKRVFILIAALFVIGLMFGASANGQVEGGAIAAIDEPAEGSGGGGRTAASGKRTSIASRASKPRSSLPAAPAKSAVSSRAKPRKWDGFVMGDKYSFLNFEVISAEKPYHTRAAKAGGAAGLVQVEVLIETDGRVLTARARTGNKLLHAEAERAAQASRFNRPIVCGKPARAIGFLVYRFGPADAEE